MQHRACFILLCLVVVVVECFVDIAEQKQMRALVWFGLRETQVKFFDLPVVVVVAGQDRTSSCAASIHLFSAQLDSRDPSGELVSPGRILEWNSAGLHPDRVLFHSFLRCGLFCFEN